MPIFEGALFYNLELLHQRTILPRIPFVSVSFFVVVDKTGTFYYYKASAKQSVIL